MAAADKDQAPVVFIRTQFAGEGQLSASLTLWPSAARRAMSCCYLLMPRDVPISLSKVRALVGQV
jgi:hypothetical protein